MKKLGILLLTSYFLLPASVLAQSVNLLYQGEGYVPPFYQGGKLWSQQTRVTLLAIPNSLGNASNLNYRWTKNGTVLGSLSGVGKNFLTFNDSVLSRSQIVKVEIVSGEEDILAEATLILTPSSPSLLVYEFSPLYGFLFNREVSGLYQMRGEEVTLTAMPYLFGTKSISDPKLTYQWMSGGEAESKNAVTYRAPDGTSGTAPVSVKVSHQDKILQTASKNFQINFGHE